MDFVAYARKPFLIQVVEVTEENLEEIAEMIGSLRKHGDGTQYIRVDHKIIPGLDRVYVGWWLTKLGENIRCYSSNSFHSQFVENTPEIDEWVEYMNKERGDADVNTESDSEGG